MQLPPDTRVARRIHFNDGSFKARVHAGVCHNNILYYVAISLLSILWTRVKPTSLINALSISVLEHALQLVLWAVPISINWLSFAARHGVIANCLFLVGA